MADQKLDSEQSKEANKVKEQQELAQPTLDLNSNLSLPTSPLQTLKSLSILKQPQLFLETYMGLLSSEDPKIILLAELELSKQINRRSEGEADYFSSYQKSIINNNLVLLPTLDSLAENTKNGKVYHQRFNHYDISHERTLALSGFPEVKKMFEGSLSSEHLQAPVELYMMSPHSLEDIHSNDNSSTTKSLRSSGYQGAKLPGLDVVIMQNMDSGILVNEMTHIAFDKLFEEIPKFKQHLQTLPKEKTMQN